ncbi:aldo/keto reductase [Leptolyngbya sp. FACHB-17]|uniref:aldo/keto reductase n=1 Tax=unclassified Leptolyngbya TaxID=2650499 RepID=UPI0016802A7B|nr:aldo/keto reductase [Leptolyngbya sp. FACHB-17]MBD2079963.1 aldo/keto reductase [Leptolyngbya sp. FACHB-17]
MLYRRFGRTELQMPVFSCGGMRYQYKWQDVPRDQVPADNQANLEATIRRAFALGIHHIETARGYGSSEMQLGQILPKIPREKLICQTKVVPMADPSSFRNTFERSLKYLKLDYVDLLGLHGINNAETLEQALRCLEVVRKLQDQGKVRSVGFSTHGLTDIITQAIETDQFDYVNLHWYYINQQNWSAIEAATRHDMGVFIISPSNKGGNLYNPPQRLVDLCAPLSPIVFNNLFCLSHPQVHTLSVGAAKPSDFDEHLKTLDLLDRADELLPPILERLEQSAIDRLGADWVKRWQTGLPTVDETPGRLNLHTILWLRNLAIAYDLVDYAKMRYNLLGQGSHWFPGARVNEIDIAALRPCLVDSPFADRIPELLHETHQLLAGEAVKRLSEQ